MDFLENLNFYELQGTSFSIKEEIKFPSWIFKFARCYTRKIETAGHLENFSIRKQQRPELTYNIPFRVFYCWIETLPYRREEYLLTAGHHSPESPLHLLAVSRQKKHDLRSFEEHFQKLAKRDVDCQAVNMIVTEVNTYYQPLIKKFFPAALHQISLHHVYENIQNRFRNFLAGFRLRDKSRNRLKFFPENHVLLLQNRQNLKEEERQQIEALFDCFPKLEIPYCFKEAVNQLLFHPQDEAEAYARRDMILENYECYLPLIMIPAIQILKIHFEQIVNHLRIKKHAIFSGQEFYRSLLN